MVYHFTLLPVMYESLLFITSTKTRLLTAFKILAILMVALDYDLNLHFLLTICSSDYWSFYILFLCSSLLGCLLLHILDKSLLAYASDIFCFNVVIIYPIFSSINFIVLTFVVSSMIHFKFISLYDRNKG